jgi:hypothetical protein
MYNKYSEIQLITITFQSYVQTLVNFKSFKFFKDCKGQERDA